jgi:hypothetical protein
MPESEEFSKEDFDKLLSELTNEEREKVSELVDLLSLGPEKGRYERMTLPEHIALGLKAVLAYYCKRCHYLWFPRDYEIVEKNIIEITPPKSCARCKSKYWNKKPQRKIKYRYGGSIAGARAYFRNQDRLKQQSKQNQVQTG